MLVSVAQTARGVHLIGLVACEVEKEVSVDHHQFQFSVCGQHMWEITR